MNIMKEVLVKSKTADETMDDYISAVHRLKLEKPKLYARYRKVRGKPINTNWFLYLGAEYQIQVEANHQ